MMADGLTSAWILADESMSIVTDSEVAQDSLQESSALAGTVIAPAEQLIWNVPVYIEFAVLQSAVPVAPSATSESG